MSVSRVASAHGSYSETVKIDGPGAWLHVAGQLGTSPDGGGAEDSLGMQAARAFDGLEAALRAQGGDLTHVVSMTTYVTSFDDWAELAAVRTERFRGDLPASTAVQVAGLIGGAAVEIDAVAFIPADG
ncbi:MAG: RidA family protein [Actinobacteria bacterium]|nr:RidA family protein [Actinomycetota bacterium]